MFELWSNCFPKYADIQGGQGGCISCGYKNRKIRPYKPRIARPRYSEAEAIKLAMSFGRTPLEPFIAFSKRWESKCMKCGTIGFAPLKTMLQRNTSSCKTCGISRSSKAKHLTQLEVETRFRDKGAELLVIYNHNNGYGLKSRCLSCSRIIYPTLNALQRNGIACKYCAGTFVDATEAKIFMQNLGFDPLEPYKGTDTPWKVVHVICGSNGTPTYGTIKRGGGGCRTCAELEFKYNKASYLYLITHEGFGAHKVGIANVSRLLKSDRLHRHQNHGWLVYEKWDFEDGTKVMQIESEVFRILRIEKNIPQFLAKGQMMYAGETGTVATSLISLVDLKKIINKSIKKVLEK